MLWGLSFHHHFERFFSNLDYGYRAWLYACGDGGDVVLTDG